MTYPSPHQPAATAALALRPDAGSYVDWPAILAGAVLAAALSVVLLTFGSAIGLTMVSPEPGEGVSLRWLTIGSGIWFVWVAIIGFAAGGYLAGRLRRPFEGATEDEVETRDGAHGVLVWATGALLGAALAASGISGLAGAAGSAAGSASQVAAEAIGGDIDYLGARLLRGGEAPVDADTARQAAAVLARGLGEGEIAPQDRDFLAGLVAERTGQTPEEAAAAVDAARAEAQQFYDAAVETAEQARIAAAIAAFVVAATLMAAAAVSYFAAVLGGDHRDRQLPFRSFGR